jgi:hypothetical protein
MGHHDQEMAQSLRGPDLETEAAWQAHYIKWAKIFGIPDPCGCYEGFIRIVAIYIKYVQRCVNYNNKQVFCSAMVQDTSRQSITFLNLEASVHLPTCPTQIT